MRKTPAISLDRHVAPTLAAALQHLCLMSLPPRKFSYLPFRNLRSYDTQKYDLGLVSNGTISVRNFIGILPVVFNLKLADRQTDRPTGVTSLQYNLPAHFLQRTHKNSNDSVQMCRHKLLLHLREFCHFEGAAKPR